MPQMLIKWAATALMSKLAKELASEVIIMTLRRWAASTETDWDDQVVDMIESKIK